MKKIMLFLVLIISTSSISQLQSIMLDWNYSLSDSITYSEIKKIDIDSDSIIDMNISSYYHDSTNVIEVLLYDGHLNANNHMIIDDCPTSWSSNEEIGGYIYLSLNFSEVQDGIPNYNYSNQSVKMPFNFNGSDGNHCGFLFVKYINFDIIIQGYIWNTISGATCSCNASGSLGVGEIKPNNDNVKFNYFNMLGQQVENPKGFVLKVFDNGTVQKVFIE